ncbi:AtpZ/AtpI family protein [Rhodospirillaceae bacterium KN72]|uniref:ATP synthase protein I n=1 Tax=Pacificispira spongiicola TaxID=2729598 RepID=A0A7Y0HEQ8_9PROT|nr:AtpZ/AtpI family protein [Pacificispira spongiicola]NMM43162.1 AtpZ/AtpI family protein [Pacificispira spongiicola]
MTEGGEKPSSDDFDARLRAAKTAHEERSGRRRKSADGSEPKTGMEGLGFALRVGTELVTATAVGVAIGFGLDYWLGTKPWLMILFVFLGGGAGVTNVYRLVSGMDSGVGWRRAGTKPPKGDDDTEYKE